MLFREKIPFLSLRVENVHFFLLTRTHRGNPPLPLCSLTCPYRDLSRFSVLPVSGDSFSGGGQVVQRSFALDKDALEPCIQYPIHSFPPHPWSQQVQLQVQAQDAAAKKDANPRPDSRVSPPSSLWLDVAPLRGVHVDLSGWVDAAEEMQMDGPMHTFWCTNKMQHLRTQM